MQETVGNGGRVCWNTGSTLDCGAGRGGGEGGKEDEE